ncbi:cAMP-responsive element modulator isoform X1 [Phycodurus eques]|uniref:cAMP-responsive element modulator isoform X1 n=1 Tax=Phycodurus eques TaxID=693459 RepID=UPI002ACD5E24|nr:cAMP-responsive element modulator isoform X1 [Phycodurus eques]
MDDSANDSTPDEEVHPDGMSPSQFSPGGTVRFLHKSSVIQSSHTTQMASESDGDSHKRRQLLYTQPSSYRKILNELSSDSQNVSKTDEEMTEEEHESTLLAPISYHMSSGQYAAISQSAAAASPGSAHQFYIHAGQMIIQAATGDIPACQLRSPTSSLAHSIVMAAASHGATHSPLSHHAEEVTRKREVRLMKNREAARECRRKKKEYVKCLENRVAVLENQNKTLIEELKALKDIYCHKGE